MTNLKFEYLYRDGGNYKQFGYIVLSNPTRLSVSTATKKLSQFLIDGEFFDPSKVGVPALEVYSFDSEIDHEWYEFEKFTETIDPVSHDIDLLNFINLFK
ncbi:MAG: hypothetical protein Roseis2KO_31280 [Roseivirga sp.]